MVNFRWKGEAARPTLVAQLGPVLQVRIKCQHGTTHEYAAADQVNGFQLNESIGNACECTRCLRILRNDARFEEY